MTGIWGLRADRIFDGERFVSGPVLVVIENGRIAGVDSSGGRPAESLPVTDLGGATLLPGLIDSHVHLAFDPKGDVVEQSRTDDDAIMLARMRVHGRQALRAGVTTVRDLGDRGYLGLALRGDFPDGPDVLVAGPPITSPRGHCWFLGGATTDVEAAVAERLERGVDVVKVMATGGGVTPGSRPHEAQFTADELRRIVDVAHRAGTPVTAHAHGPAGIRAAVAAGVDGIEHCTFLTADGVDVDWATVADIARTGIFVGVTAARLHGGAPLAPRVITARRATARMHREGVRLVCSSDAGVAPFKPHDCLPHGLGEFADFADLSISDTLTAVTALAAESCGVGDRKGRIRAGYDADLLAVAGDPSRDLTTMTAPRLVVRAGVVVRT